MRQNLAEFGRIWQNLAEFSRIWQNWLNLAELAEFGRFWVSKWGGAEKKEQGGEGEGEEEGEFWNYQSIIARDEQKANKLTNEHLKGSMHITKK